MEYDGSQVLEKLAEIDKETIDLVIRAMREADGDQ